MNLRHRDTIPTYRENTVESFLCAAEAGATFVEFDVQVTTGVSCSNHHVALLKHECHWVASDAK